MYRIEYSHDDYEKMIEEMAKKMDTKIKCDTLVIPETIATGYFKFNHLSNGLQYLLSEFTANQDVYLQRNKSTKEFYTLRFDEISISDTLMVKIDNDYIWEEKQNRASVFLTSSLFDFAYQIPAGTAVKSINILITRKWLQQYLNIKSLDKILQKYLLLKTATYNFAPFDIEYRSLFNEVLENNDAAMKKSIAENRIMMMAEKFLTQLYQKLSPIGEAGAIKIPEDEIKRLMEVESYLIKDFSTPPPPISFLSRVAAMSTTTLKNKFKKLYGNNLYEYFQKSRMHKAKIKQIGNQLGYANLSNFAAAFKKEFNLLPSQLMLQ